MNEAETEVVRRDGSVPEVSPKIDLTPTSLTFTEEPSWGEWVDVGRQLQQMGRSWQWWVGDWLAYGEHEWGEKYAQAVEATGKSVETLKRTNWVANRFEERFRHRNLSYSHHEEVAASDHRHELLGCASRNDWSVAGLRRVRREEKMVEEAGEDPEPVIKELEEAQVEADVARDLIRQYRKAMESGERGEVSIHQGDSVDWLASLEEGRADLLLTDPPYLTEFETVGDFSAFVDRWFPLALTRLRPSARAYVFVGAYPEELSAYLDSALQGKPSRWTVDPPLVWTYRNTLGPSPEEAYKLNWQAVIHLRGPEAPALDCPEMVEQFTVQDVAAPDGRHPEGRRHQWEKPVNLGERFVRHATAEGDLVLDPFCGTGALVESAVRQGRDALAAERDPDMIALAEGRGLEAA